MTPAGTLITLAPTGAEPARADVPALPVTVDEVVAAARDCRVLSAAVLHLLVRGTDTRPTPDLPRVREVLAAVRAGLARIAQRPPLSPFEARQLLGIPVPVSGEVPR